MLKEFREFAARGNVVDMAVGVILGAAFGAIVKALVDEIIMPPVGLLLGNVDFGNLYLILQAGTPAGPYASLSEAKKAGAVVLGYGVFINALVSFAIVAFAVFLLLRGINRLRRQPSADAASAPDSKACTYCCSSIPRLATRCPHCTSSLT